MTNTGKHKPKAHGNYRRRIFLILFADIAALFSAYFLSIHAADFISGLLAPEKAKHEFVLDERYLFFLLSLIAIFLFYNSGHYTKRVPWWSQVRHTIIVFICLMVASGFLHFAMHYSFQRLPALLFWLVAWVSLIIMRQLAHIIGRILKIWSIPTVVIGDGENAIDAIYALCSDRYSGYDVHSMLLYHDFEGFSQDILPLRGREIEIIKGPENSVDYINHHREDFYVLAPEALQHIDGEKLIALIAKVCGRENYAIVPPTKGLALYGQIPDFFFGYDIMLFHPLARINYPYKRIIKGIMDITLSLLALIIFLPLFLLIPLLIKLEGRGPVLFAHKRIGQNGKSFKCLKFRTMVSDAERRLEVYLRRNPEARDEWEKEFKLKDDPRVTKIGGYLRRTSLDELPQIFNILAGNMSFVGPRPIIEQEKQYYGKKFKAYSSVKPGITGLWQVSGRSNVTYKYRIYLDSWYVENWSVWYDVVILVKTVLVILRRSGAY